MLTALLYHKFRLSIVNLTAMPANSQKAAVILKISGKLYTAFIVPQYNI